MASTEATVTEARLLATASLTLPDPGPEGFLRRYEGQPRGFWSRGRRWIAHGGTAARLRVESGDGTSGAGASPAELAGSDPRFTEIARQARELRSGPSARDARGGGLRFYGGFSFLAGHHDEERWEGFPAATFILPAIELEGGDPDGRSVLRARVRVPSGREWGAVQAELQALLEGVRDDLVAEPGPPGPAPSISCRVGDPGRDEWDRAMDDLLGALGRGEVRKVVLARVLDVEPEEPGLDPVRVVLGLRDQNPRSHTFLFEPEPGRTLVGAAPETVVTLRNGVFHATAVAGSIARGQSEAERVELAERLLDSGKDRVEHRIAVEDMVERLRTMTPRVRFDAEPHVLTLARIQHLESEIRAWVPEDRSALDLLGLLHPTPAVCGLPRDRALELLARDEPFERGWYAGPVGWFDLSGDGVFAPALRTAVRSDRGWRLFAGAGIVEGSEAGAEWDETAIKFQPMLRALQAAGARLPDGPE